MGILDGLNINTVVQTITAIGLGAVAFYLANEYNKNLLNLYRDKKDKKDTSNNSNVGSSAMVELLRNTLVEFILNEDTQNIVIIDSKSTLDYALMRMNENNVVSLPVVDLEHKKYIGTLSIVDIATFVGRFPNQDAPQSLVSEVLKYNREPFIPLYVNSSIQLLIHIMTHNVPQVPIMSSDTIVVDMVSRLHVLKFIYENIDELGSKSTATIKSLDLLSTSISQINSEDKLIEAINILNRDQVTEVAVVDNDGKLIGSFSASDLRKLSVYTFNRLDEPISKFITLDPDSVFVTNPSNSLRMTIKKFVENNAEILWVVDINNRPISSITLISLMKYFLHAINDQPTNNI